MSDHAWTWHELGSALVIDTTPAGWLRVEVNGEGLQHHLAELPPRAVVELAEWLDAESGNGLGQRLAEVEAECRQIEEERDVLLDERDGLVRKIDYLEHLTEALQIELARARATVAEAVATGLSRS